MSFRSFVRWTLGTAVAIPLAPLGLIYAFTHKSTGGSDGWGTLGILAGSIMGSLALAGLVVIALINPAIAGCVYGGLCLAVGLKMGMKD